MHSENVFAFSVRPMEVWESNKRKGENNVFTPTFFTAHVHRQWKDNRVILTLRIFLNFGQLNSVTLKKNS